MDVEPRVPTEVSELAVTPLAKVAPVNVPAAAVTVIADDINSKYIHDNILLDSAINEIVNNREIVTSYKLKEDERHKGVRVFTIHFLTPVSETECIDRWMHLRNIQIEDDDVSQKMDEMFRIAFEEDKVILEAIQQEELRSTGEQAIKLAIDKAPNVYRLRIRRLIENELNKNN